MSEMWTLGFTVVSPKLDEQEDQEARASLFHALAWTSGAKTIRTARFTGAAVSA